MNLQRLFAYDTWANREEVTHLRGIDAPPRAVGILAHIVGAEWLWLGRIRGATKPAMVWPKLTLDQAVMQIDQLDAEWKVIVASSDLQTSVEYTNSKGERWTSNIGDILLHVIIHGAYHRGQIATIVRDGGDTPAYTDYIHCVRNGWI